MTLARKKRPTGMTTFTICDPTPSKHKISLIRSYLENSYHVHAFRTTKAGAEKYLNIRITDEEWRSSKCRIPRIPIGESPDV